MDLIPPDTFRSPNPKDNDPVLVYELFEYASRVASVKICADEPLGTPVTGPRVPLYAITVELPEVAGLHGPDEGFQSK